MTVDDATNSPSSKELDRGNWGKPIEFMLACMNYALGLGNVWRFPYLCFRNGGGAFLIPFLIMVLLVGMPLFFAELVIGQYSGLGPIKAFAFLTPLFKGMTQCICCIHDLFKLQTALVRTWLLFSSNEYFHHNLLYGHHIVDLVLYVDFIFPKTTLWNLW